MTHHPSTSDFIHIAAARPSSESSGSEGISSAARMKEKACLSLLLCTALQVGTDTINYRGNHDNHAFNSLPDSDDHHVMGQSTMTSRSKDQGHALMCECQK